MLHPSSHLVAHVQLIPIIQSYCHNRQENNSQWSLGVRAGHLRACGNHDFNLVTHYVVRSGKYISPR